MAAREAIGLASSVAREQPAAACTAGRAATHVWRPGGSANLLINGDLRGYSWGFTGILMEYISNNWVLICLDGIFHIVNEI